VHRFHRPFERRQIDDVFSRADLIIAVGYGSLNTPEELNRRSTSDRPYRFTSSEVDSITCRGRDRFRHPESVELLEGMLARTRRASAPSISCRLPR